MLLRRGEVQRGDRIAIGRTLVVYFITDTIQSAYFQIMLQIYPKRAHEKYGRKLDE